MCQSRSFILEVDVTKLTTLAGTDPCGSDTCPAVHLDADGRLLVQGRRAGDTVRSSLVLGAAEELVEIPLELLEQALDAVSRLQSER
jgi:hypothetical protein